MSWQLELSNALCALRIDHTNSTTAKADVGLLRRRIASDVVGVLQIDAANRGKGLRIVNIACATLVVCDDQPSGLCHIANALRVSKTCDGMNALSFLQVDYFQAVVAQRADKQPL